MQNWSQSDQGWSPQPPPALTPHPPAQTLCTLRSSSKRNSYKHSSLAPPGEGRDSALQTELSGIKRTVFMNHQYGIQHLCFCQYTTTVSKRGFCVSPAWFHSSTAAFRSYNSVVCLLASLACEPDVYKNALTVNCFV